MIIPVRYLLRITAPVSLVAILLGGCQSADKPRSTGVSGGKYYAVASDSAKFFRYGPQQGNGPDLTLQKDTLVKVIRPSFGYCKIELVSSGQQGYVASEDIKVAPPALVAIASGTTAAESASHRSAEQFNLNSTDTRLLPPPEQLPDPDLPPQAPDPAQTPGQ